MLNMVEIWWQYVWVYVQIICIYIDNYRYMYLDSFVFRANMREFTYIIETNGCEEKRATETAEYFLEPFDYKTAHMHDKQNHNEATTRSKPNDFPILT